MTPRQIVGLSILRDRRRRRELQQLMTVMSVAAQCDSKGIKKMSDELLKS